MKKRDKIIRLQILIDKNFTKVMKCYQINCKYNNMIAKLRNKKVHKSK